MMKKEMRKKRMKLWLVFFIILTAFSLFVLMLALIFGLTFKISVIISAGYWLALTLWTLISGYIQTPHMYRDMVELFGEYIGKPLEPGPHILFPYFGFEVIHARVYMGEQKLELYLNEKEGNGGDIELEDCSASLLAFFFFRIYNPKMATYNIDNLLGALAEKADHIIRAFFGVYTLDEAIQLKSFFRIQNVASLIDASSDTPNKKLKLEELRKIVVSDEDARKTQFYKNLASWGVKPVSFAISDIEIPDEIKEQRARVLTAEKDKEVAKIEIKTAEFKAEKVVIDAQAQAEQARLEGEGEARKVKAIMESTEMIGGEVANYLVTTTKWKAIGQNANVTLIEDSGGKTADGVRIGVGIGSTGKKVESKVESKNEKS
jgi:regulator of protease activity HflC (stomatin/prohibitin superfamily)